MRNQTVYLLLIALLGFTVSCSTDDNGESIVENIKNVTDCGLSTDPQFIGLCMDGAESAIPNEVITYASKSTLNFSEISWIVESGSIEILNVENSITEGANKSIATIKFKSDFSGGSLKVRTFNDEGEFSEILNYQIELENQ